MIPMGKKFVDLLDKLNHEAGSLPKDEEIPGRVEHIEGDNAHVIMEPSDGHIINMDIPVRTLSDSQLKVEVGATFIFRRDGKPLFKPHTIDPMSKTEADALIQRVNERFKGLEL